MALISCPECNSKVSDKAASCIQCGYPLIKPALKLTDKLGRTVAFSDRVIILPNILSIFGRPLWEANPSRSLQTRPWNYWDWIKRGEILCEFNVYVRSFFSEKRIVIPVRSPVSGLLLDPEVHIAHKNEFFTTPPEYTLTTRILLPENEPVPKDASGMYGEFSSICRSNPDIFFKPKEFKGWHTIPLWDEAIKRIRLPISYKILKII